MLCDLGVVDRLVTTALFAAPSSLIYVARGDPQPNDATNPDGKPWFMHKLRMVSSRKQINPSEPDRALLRVTMAVFAPGGAMAANVYAVSAALTTVAGLLAFLRLADSPFTHEVVFDGYEAEQDFGADNGDGGQAALLHAGLVTVNGLVCRVA